MKRSVSLWQLWGFAFTSICGTLLHYLYEWTGKSPAAAPVSGVNESTWEHMKLLFFPMLAYAIFQSFFFRDIPEYPCIKLRGTLLGICLIPVIFYTANGAIGKTPDWVNILIFFVSAAMAYYYETKLFKSGRRDCRHPLLSVAALTAIAILFAVFTFITPEIGLFRDPLTGTYGI